MNLWLLACLVTYFVGIWASAVQAQGVFEDCCLAYNPHVRLTLLQHAQRYLRQDVSGSCNLPAVKFYFLHKQKTICGNPQAKWVQDGMKLLDTQSRTLRKHHRDIRRNFQGFHTGKKKLSSGTSRLSLSTLRGHQKQREECCPPKNG